MSTTLGFSAADREAGMKKQTPARATRESKKEWREYFIWIQVMLGGT